MFNSTLTISPILRYDGSVNDTQVLVSDISYPIQIESNYSVGSINFGPVGITGNLWGVNLYSDPPYTQTVPDLTMSGQGGYAGVAVNILENAVNVGFPSFYRGQSLKKVNDDFYGYDKFENGAKTGK